MVNILKISNNLILISLLYIHPEKGSGEVQIIWTFKRLRMKLLVCLMCCHATMNKPNERIFTEN